MIQTEPCKRQIIKSSRGKKGLEIFNCNTACQRIMGNAFILMQKMLYFVVKVDNYNPKRLYPAKL
jgi:hypothetical protein